MQLLSYGPLTTAHLIYQRSNERPQAESWGDTNGRGRWALTLIAKLLVRLDPPQAKVATLQEPCEGADLVAGTDQGTEVVVKGYAFGRPHQMRIPAALRIGDQRAERNITVDADSAVLVPRTGRLAAPLEQDRSSAGSRMAETPAPRRPWVWHWSRADGSPLVGDEELVLEHLHPHDDRIQIGLPELTVSARLDPSSSSAERPIVALQLTTLRVETDRRRAALIWRTTVDIDRPDAIANAELALHAIGAAKTDAMFTPKTPALNASGGGSVPPEQQELEAGCKTARVDIPIPPPSPTPPTEEYASRAMAEAMNAEDHAAITVARIVSLPIEPPALSRDLRSALTGVPWAKDVDSADGSSVGRWLASAEPLPPRGVEHAHHRSLCDVSYDPPIVIVAGALALSIDRLSYVMTLSLLSEMRHGPSADVGHFRTTAEALRKSASVGAVVPDSLVDDLSVGLERHLGWLLGEQCTELIDETQRTLRSAGRFHEVGGEAYGELRPPGSPTPFLVQVPRDVAARLADNNTSGAGELPVRAVAQVLPSTRQRAPRLRLLAVARVIAVSASTTVDAEPSDVAAAD